MAFLKTVTFRASGLDSDQRLIQHRLGWAHHEGE